MNDQDGPAARATSSENASALIPIGHVVEALQLTYPDVTHSSLRFLEREGLVLPTRTPGGHRLYSQQDLDRIRQVKAWQAQRLSLEEIRQRLLGLEQSVSPAALSDQFLTAAVAGNLARAAAVIRGADELGMSLDVIFVDVLRPALYEVGTQWESGSLPVGQEKEISELARDLIAELSTRHADPDAKGPTIVAACVAGERHDLGLRMVVARLRARGWRVHFLGADVDPHFLQERVQQWRPDLVLLSATRAERLSDLADAIHAVRGGGKGADMAVVVGGGQLVRAEADAIRALGAVPALGDGLDDVLAIAQASANNNQAGAAASEGATP